MSDDTQISFSVVTGEGVLKVRNKDEKECPSCGTLISNHITLCGECCSLAEGHPGFSSVEVMLNRLPVLFEV